MNLTCYVADVIDGCKRRRIRWKKRNVCSCAGDAEAKKRTGTATGRKITGLLALAGLPRVGRWCGEGTRSRRWLGPASTARHNLAPLLHCPIRFHERRAGCAVSCDDACCVFSFRHLLLFRLFSCSHPRVSPAAPPFSFTLALDCTSAENTFALEQGHISTHTHISIIPPSLLYSPTPDEVTP